MERRSPAAPQDLPSPLEAADLGLQLGALLLESGASTGRVVKVVRGVLSRFGLPHAEAVVTPELMAIVSGDGSLAHPVMCVTPRIRWNIHRLAHLEPLVGQALSGAGDAGNYRQLQEELERIQALPSPYSRWMFIVAWSCVGAALSRLFHADWPGTMVAALACAVGQWVRGALGYRLNLGLTTLVTAVVAAFVGALGLRFQLSHTPIETLTSSVALLVPSLWLITGGLDVIGGRQIRFGLLRLTVALLIFFTIVLGIGIAHAIVL